MRGSASGRTREGLETNRPESPENAYRKSGARFLAFLHRKRIFRATLFSTVLHVFYRRRGYNGTLVEFVLCEIGKISISLRLFLSTRDKTSEKNVLTLFLDQLISKASWAGFYI